jgi:Protein of unknown function (DUF3040)
VEVVIVLDPYDKRVFEGMVERMHADDPKFVRRIDRLGSPRRRLRATMAILLWTITPFCIVLGGWTGLIMAVVAAGYGVKLINKRSGMTGGTNGFSWWSSGKRPGASI